MRSLRLCESNASITLTKLNKLRHRSTDKPCLNSNFIVLKHESVHLHRSDFGLVLSPHYKKQKMSKYLLRLSMMQIINAKNT